MRETAEPRLNPVINFLIAGSATAAGRAFAHDLSVLKTMAQAGTPGANRGPFQAAKSLSEHYGVFKGLYKGMIPAMVRIFPYAGIQYLTYDTLVRNFSDRRPGVVYREQPKVLSLAITAVAGGVAGVLAQIATHPLDLIKVRMTLQSPVPSEMIYKSMQECYTKIIEKEGFAGLYRALPISVVGAGVYSGTMFLLWDIGDNLPWRRIDGRPIFTLGQYSLEWFVYPAIAMAGANIVSHPIDLIRKKMMAFTHEEKLTDFEVPKSTWEVVKKIYKFNGLPGFFQGIFANFLKPTFQLPVILLAMSFAQLILAGKKPFHVEYGKNTKVYDQKPI